MTIAERLEDILEELIQIEIDAQDIGMTGAAHKIMEARGPLYSAVDAAEQWDEFV